MIKLLFIVLTSFSFIINGCGSKNSVDTSVNKIFKDQNSGVEKAVFNYNQEKGKVLKFKCTINNWDAISPAPPKKIEEMDKFKKDYIYFLSQEVEKVSDNRIDYKIIFDSIITHQEFRGKTSHFNSTNDYYEANTPYFEFNSVVHHPFYISMEKNGVIKDVYGLEEILKTMKEKYGKEYSSENQETMKESYKYLLQLVTHTVPVIISADSSWKNEEFVKLRYPYISILCENKIDNMDQQNNKVSVNLSSGIKIDKITTILGVMEIVSYEIAGNGSGNLVLDIEKGCVKSKDFKYSVKYKQDTRTVSNNVPTTDMVEVEETIKVEQLY
ncbi:MAG: hypothetical protein EHM58_19150 [Ignavibacteriae bacterium]|nr:MAG: hypothetical protein EHM58_19150 [Ignavibacteriota bacterium]